MSESDFALGFKQGRAVEHAVMLEMIEDIKAEIEKELCHSIRDEYSQRQNDYCDGVEFAGKRCLEIIDKHIGKAESEDI